MPYDSFGRGNAVAFSPGVLVVNFHPSLHERGFFEDRAAHVPEHLFLAKQIQFVTGESVSRLQLKGQAHLNPGAPFIGFIEVRLPIVDVVVGPLRLLNPSDDWFPPLRLYPVLLVAVMFDCILITLAVIWSSQVSHKSIASSVHGV